MSETRSVNKVIATSKGYLLIVEEDMPMATMRRLSQQLNDATGDSWQVLTNSTWRDPSKLLTGSIKDIEIRIAKMDTKMAGIDQALKEMDELIAKLGK